MELRGGLGEGARRPEGTVSGAFRLKFEAAYPNLGFELQLRHLERFLGGFEVRLRQLEESEPLEVGDALGGDLRKGLHI